MSLENKMTHLRVVREHAVYGLLRIGIVVGWLRWAETVQFQRYVSILHWWYWLGFLFVGLGMTAVVIWNKKIPSGIPSDSMLEDKGVKTAVQNIFNLHVYANSWIRKGFFWALTVPSLVFVSVFMGDWSLFTPMLLADMGNGILLKMASEMWKNFPEKVRDPSNTDKIVVAASSGPVATMVADLKTKREKEEEVAEDVVDKIMGE